MTEKTPAPPPDAFTQMLRADPRCNVIEPASSETRRDELMKALEANPRFKMVKPSGQGFIICAAQRPKGGG